MTEQQEKPNQEPTMKSYRPAAPRAVFTLAAVAMTVLTLGLSVLPARVDSGAGTSALASASPGTSPAAVAASGDGMPIMVYGVRDKETAMQKVRVPHAQKVHVPHVVPPQRQQI
jgi:predicted RNA methylase